MRYLQARARWSKLADFRALTKNGFRLPTQYPCRPTLKRQLNLFVNRWEQALRRTRLLSYPWMLSIEPTNRCNLRCPYCFTGAGGVGRRASLMPLDVYRGLLAEIGDYLLVLKVHGWGEPVLCKHLHLMIADAKAMGIWTVVNSSLSLPLDADRADLLVGSGLDRLVVSIDGAEQNTYAQYRVGGDLERVLRNIRLVDAAKRGLGSSSPSLVLEFHPFPWNAHEVASMRRLAEELEIAITVYKGCMPGGDWDERGEWQFCVDPVPVPCSALWSLAVVAADGGVQPCNGTFYRQDDMGRIDPSALQGGRFRDVWNNERYRLARRFFHARAGNEEEKRHVCYACPQTILWERWLQHVMAGGDWTTFEIGVTTSDAWSYFWNRRPEDAPRIHSPGADRRTALPVNAPLPAKVAESAG